MASTKTVKQKRIVFDLDGCLCTQVTGDYREARPIPEAIALINRLYERGHTIIIHTARFMNRNNQDQQRAQAEGHTLTERQLADWGVRYHQLILGKPSADIIIDDRAVFFRPDWAAIEAAIEGQPPVQ